MLRRSRGCSSGLLIGGIPGTLIGLAMGMNTWVRAYFGPVIALLYPIPKIAILPLFYFIFGTGEAAKWAAVAVGVFFLMAINTEAGVRQIETIYLDVARAYRIRPATFFFRVLLPGALPNIYAGMKLSIGIAIVLAVAAEYQLTRTGLGFAIFNAQQLLDVERLYAALVAVSLLGFGAGGDRRCGRSGRITLATRIAARDARTQRTFVTPPPYPNSDRVVEA